MNKKTGIAFVIIAIIVTPLLLLGIYLFAPVLLIGGDVQSKVVQVQALNRTPTNYKKNFAKWEYTRDPSTGLLTATLQSQFGQEEKARPGVIIEDGSYGSHVVDLATFKESLERKSGTDKTAAFLLEMVEAIETRGGSTMKKCNPGNLAIAIVANCQNEGKPFEWEETPKWRSKGEDWFETKDGIRYVFIGTELKTAVGTVSSDDECIMTTKDHITNAATIWEKYKWSPLCNGIGCGIVQWTSGRCGAYLDYLSKNVKEDDDLEDEATRRKYDIDYLMWEYEDYMKRNLKSDNYENISVESLTGWTTARYETPYHSAYFHFSKKDNNDVAEAGRTIEVFTENGGSFPITSGNDFFDGTITDFSEQHYWRWKDKDGRVRDAEVAESTRIRHAIDLYNEYYVKGVNTHVEGY